MKNILVVCQHYFPENFQITDICEELVKKGYMVTALVGLPNYPGGYILKNYKHHKNRKEIINGVNIVRCGEIARRKGILFLALNYISFWLTSTIKVKKLQDNYDLVIGYETSPITMVYAGKKHAKKYKKPFYIFCVDIWPECLKVYIKSEKNLIFRLFTKISNDIYSSADKILCTSRSFIEYLKKFHHINNEMIYLPQFGDDSLLKMNNRNNKNKEFNFVFMGNIGKEQNLSNVILSMSKTKNTNYLFHIIGVGSDLQNVKETTNKLQMNGQVVFHGYKTKKELIKYYEMSDACIISLKNDNLIGSTLPNKMQNYMASGKPVLGMISGSTKEVIEESNCGLCVEGNDIDGFTKILDYFIDNPSNIKIYSNNSRNYYMRNFKKTVIIDKLISIIE